MNFHHTGNASKKMPRERRNNVFNAVSIIFALMSFSLFSDEYIRLDNNTFASSNFTAAASNPYKNPASAPWQVITVLNGNFESDVGLPATGSLPIAQIENKKEFDRARQRTQNEPNNSLLAEANRISGWGTTGTGFVGTVIPDQNLNHYYLSEGKGQVASLANNARISQKTGEQIKLGEKYTLFFDLGFPTEKSINLAAKLKVNGEVLAVKHIYETKRSYDNFWQTYSFDAVVTEASPIGEQLSIEFYNLSRTASTSFNDTALLDNIRLEKHDLASDYQTALNYAYIRIPGDYATIPGKYAFAAGGTVNIYIDDCTDQVYSDPIVIDLPKTHLVEIAATNGCVIQFNNSSGFVIHNGSQLKRISNIEIRGWSDDSDSEYIGIEVKNNSIAEISGRIKITGFHTGTKSINNSLVSLNGYSSPDYAPPILVNQNENGLQSQYKSQISLKNIGAQSNNKGLFIENSSSINMFGSSAITRNLSFDFVSTGNTNLLNYSTPASQDYSLDRIYQLKSSSVTTLRSHSHDFKLNLTNSNFNYFEAPNTYYNSGSSALPSDVQPNKVKSNGTLIRLAN